VTDSNEGDASDAPDATDSAPPENDGQRFDRLPATADERDVPGRPSREEVVDWWEQRYGIAPETWDGHTFWEKGNGKLWAFADDVVSPIEVEGLGLRILRARQEHWKPSTNAVQRFATDATKNVVVLDAEEATRFAKGEDQELPRWDGDWGYVVAAHEIAGDVETSETPRATGEAGGVEPIGVGLYLHGELRSTVPKGRREDLS
jgi:NOL1/NOP2/fmu family ribosome biogenesis protein